MAITIVYQYPKLNIISGYAAKNMASTVFIASRTAESVNENDHQVALINLAETTVDKKDKSANSSVFGLMSRRAVYRPGLGAVLLTKDGINPKKVRKPNRSIKMDSDPFPFGHSAPLDTVLPEVDYELLEQALDKAFAHAEVQRTRTVMVVYKNQLIGEKYAPGFSRATPVLGWSMTKSILATLYGILAQKDQVNIHNSTGWTDWQDDERRQITFDHLLRMQSGLEWDEDYTDISDVTRMLFLESDMGLVQSVKPLVAGPGTLWNYSSGTSNLLSRLLREQFNSFEEYRDFPYTELIDRIGMHSMLVETDLAGFYVGSSYGWASTGDWAKFGLLYLNRGSWQGDQILSPDWCDYVSKPTPGSDGDYGAHFWLNAGGKFPDAPRDLYFAKGYQGQYVFIIPSKSMVIVRTGLAEEPNFDVNAFLSDILGAIQ